MPTDPLPAGTTRHPGGCLQPVLLRGRIDHIDGTTGELLHRYTTVHEPGGVLPIAYKTRRASQCPPCAEVYRADTYQLIRAGLRGGKGIPETVATHPCVFTTLTAPSFGPVHVQREKDGKLLRCRPRRRSETCPHGNRLSCGKRHTCDDNQLGEPLCPDCYDYTGAVLFNACAPELWRRFTITLRRSLARLAGITNKALAAQVRVSFAKVAEYQRRGVVHLHAIIRLDGPAGPTTPPPAWAAVALLTAAIAHAARSVNLQTPAALGLPGRTLAWGRELDIRPVTGELTDSKVAAYVAKYATKAAECTGTLDRRITPTDQLNALPIREHARRHIAECIRLSKLPGLEDLRLPPGRTCSASPGTSPRRAALIPRPRVVSIDDATVGVLRQHRADQAADQLRAGDSWRGTKDSHVFTTGWGEPIYPDTVTSLMTKLIRAQNNPDNGKHPRNQLPHARLHDLRHLHATTLLLSGVPVHVVAARLGHADPAITLRVYAHVIRSAEAAAADIFARAVNAA